MTVKDILEKLGYSPKSANTHWRVSALYRKSNSLSVSVHKENGLFYDFVTGQNGPLSYLIALTKNIGRSEADKYLVDLNANFGTSSWEDEKESNIKNEEKFDQEFLSDLLPSYGFYKNRGISEDTLKLFRGGVKTYGKLNNRFVFPIFDDNNNIIGISGRELFQKSDRPKWKILGKKTNFVYPFNITGKYIELSKSVILVESIGDGLALYEAGIKNFLVLFGTKVSKAIVLYLIRSNVEKVVIATNNDFESSQNVGQIAAVGIKNSLSKFFNINNLEIRLPNKNDFGEMSSEEIIGWANFKPAKTGQNSV